MKIQRINQIDSFDWDELVQDTYGRPYCFQQQDDCKPRGVETITIPVKDYTDMYDNDTILEVINGEEMGVSFEAWLTRDPKSPLNPSEEELKNSNYYWGKTEEEEMEWKQDISHINMFYERNFYPDVQMIANDLYEKGLIEAGDYQINID